MCLVEIILRYFLIKASTNILKQLYYFRTCMLSKSFYSVCFFLIKKQADAFLSTASKNLNFKNYFHYWEYRQGLTFGSRDCYNKTCRTHLDLNLKSITVSYVTAILSTPYIYWTYKEKKKAEQNAYERSGFQLWTKAQKKKKHLKPTNKKDISSPSRVTDSYGASSSPQEEARAYSLCPRGRRPSRARWSSLPPPRGPPSGPLQSPRPRTFPCPLPVTPGPWCHPAHAARRALQAASASPARVLPRPPSSRA